MFSKIQICSSLLTHDYQTNRKSFRQKNWAIFSSLVPRLPSSVFACCPVSTYVQPLAGKQLKRARHGGKAERNATLRITVIFLLVFLRTEFFGIKELSSLTIVKASLLDIVKKINICGTKQRQVFSIPLQPACMGKLSVVRCQILSSEGRHIRNPVRTCLFYPSSSCMDKLEVVHC